MKKQKNLILPEEVVIELMALTSRLGEIAMDYNRKIGGKETDDLLRLYTGIVRKLMNLEHQDINNKQSFTFDEMLNSVGVKRGDNNGNN